MNKNRENVLLSFWLPFRKSNFINYIDDTTEDNLVNKIINFTFDYYLDVKAFDINLTNTEYKSIFKLQETKPSHIQREHVKKHLSGGDIQLTGQVKKTGGKEESIKIHDVLTEYKYKLSKKDFDKSSEVNFSKSKISNINHLCLKFKFTDESIKKFDKLKLFNDDRKKFTPSLLKSLEFMLLIDEYGFYFIDVDIYEANFFVIDYKMIQLFIKIFFSWEDDKFSILTVDQKHIIKDGLLFEYDIKKDDTNTKKDNENLKKIENFFKKIIQVYHYKDFQKQENFDILPSKELVYIIDKRNDNELQQRIYNIPFLDYSYTLNKNHNKIVKEWILDTHIYLHNHKIKFLYKLFLQDQIEKEAMSRFLEVSTSINYIGQIINQIKEARDKLRELITDTTEIENDDNEINSNNKKKNFSEEELARYIEKIFSKIPNLKTIDTFLQEAYYIKVGNYSFISYIEDSENIATLYQYIKWKNLLNNIDNTALSLETILQVYQNRQSLEELEELRQNELSTSDKNDVRNISDNEKQNIILDESQKDFFVILGLLIAFSDFYKGMWNSIFSIFFEFSHNTVISAIFSLASAIVILFGFSKMLPYIYKIIFQTKEKIHPNFLGINTIELRSKKKLDIQIMHEQDHNFTKKIDQIISYIENNIDESFKEILDIGRRRILFTRINPRKRKIQIKYIFDENHGNNFFELSSLKIKKKELNNKNLKIKFFIVYHFILKLNKESEGVDFFDLYNNSAKVYFNIGTVGRLKQKNKIKKDEDIIRQQFYKIFLENFNTK